MKRRNGFVAAAACALLIALGAAPASYGQGQSAEPARRLEIVFGPRVGVTAIAVSPQEFDDSMQEVFPDADRSYFPIFTQFGLSVEQRIRLGDTESHFAFQEVLIFGGLDQSLVIPSLSVLIGFRSRAGLELGLGPNISMKRSGEEATGVGVSVVYAAGWSFNFSGVYVPVNVAVVPTPSDGAARFTLLTGFNFVIRPRARGTGTGA